MKELLTPGGEHYGIVDDDDGNESPSTEPRTDSRSALPMKNRRWRRLRIIKHDDSFSLIFSS
jgi:hypothetical protein